MEAVAIEQRRRRQHRPHEGAVVQVIDVWVSFTLGPDGRLRDGMLASAAFVGALDAADAIRVQGLKLSALLFNCCEPEVITVALRHVHGCEYPSQLWGRLRMANVCLGAYANRLTAEAPDWTFEGSPEPQPLRTDLDPAHYSEINDYHVKIIGGCCGITPEHIAHLPPP
jgi:S-methylmethionine-dependent homocysteine/selenocysteine methylase